MTSNKRKKEIIGLFLFLSILFAFAAVIAYINRPNSAVTVVENHANTNVKNISVYFNPSNYNYKGTDNIEVNIYADIPSDIRISGMTFLLNYPKDLLTLDQTRSTDPVFQANTQCKADSWYLDTNIAVADDATQGIATLAKTSLKDFPSLPVGKVCIGTVSFKLKPNVTLPTTATITFNKVVDKWDFAACVYNVTGKNCVQPRDPNYILETYAPIFIEPSSATVTISGLSVTSAPTLSPTINPTLSSTPTIMPSLSPTPSAISTITQTPTLLLSPTQTPTVMTTLTPTSSPTPTITVSGSGTGATDNSTPTPTSGASTVSSTNSTLTLTIPQGKQFTLTTPELTGTAPAGATVEVTVHSATQSGRVIADANGNWQFTPTQALDIGTHTYSATIIDSNGVSTDQVGPVTFSVVSLPNTGIYTGALTLILIGSALVLIAMIVLIYRRTSFERRFD